MALTFQPTGTGWLVVSNCGMPLGYEVFEGNRNDVKTWQEIVTKMEARYGKADRIWSQEPPQDGSLDKPSGAEADLL